MNKLSPSIEHCVRRVTEAVTVIKRSEQLISLKVTQVSQGSLERIRGNERGEPKLVTDEPVEFTK